MDADPHQVEFALGAHSPFPIAANYRRLVQEAETQGHGAAARCAAGLQTTESAGSLSSSKRMFLADLTAKALNNFLKIEKYQVKIS